MIDVIVIGQNYSTSLGLIKAITQGGYHCALVRCIAGKDRFSPPDVKSRYTEEYIYLPRNDDASVIKGLIDRWGDSEKKKVIIPADDYSASLIDSYKALLSPFFCFPHSLMDNGVLSYMDKERQKKIVSKKGILTPKCCLFPVKNDFSNHIVSVISFPCMVKPLMSLGAYKSWITCCKSIEDLRALLDRIRKSKRCPEKVLIEDYIEIESEFTIPCLSLVDRVYIPAFIEKTVVAQGNHKGVTICGRVVSGNQFASFRDKLIEAIKEFRILGLLDIEVFYSKGAFYLNEINFRNGAAGYSLTCSGINLPNHLVDYLLKGSLPDTSRWQLRPLSFVNDKANIESFCSRHLSFKQYVRNIKDSDVRLVAEYSDRSAYNAFKKIEVLSVLKRAF